MSIVKAKILGANGKKQYAVLHYADFLKLREQLEKFSGKRCLEAAGEGEEGAPEIDLGGLKHKAACPPRRVRRTAGKNI